jgi:GNAT superfamily N-acetyltransferase
LTSSSELSRILEFRRGIAERSSTRVVRFAYGTAWFNDDFPLSWAHNYLEVVATQEVDAGELIAEAHRLHGSAEQRHRTIEVTDEALGERLEPAFRDAGWEIDRHVVMVHRRGFDRAVDTSSVEELPFSDIRPAIEEYWRQLPEGDSEETVRQLVERTAVTAAACELRHLAVRAGQRVVSTCDLYVVGSVAQLEDVWTHESHRGRGYARAAVARAVEEARGAGCDLVWLDADARDWPRELYRKLGFDAVAHTHTFTLTP